MNMNRKEHFWCGKLLFTYDGWDDMDIGEIQFYEVKFPYASMKQFDGLCVSFNLEGLLNIYSDEGVLLWTGYPTDIPEWNEVYVVTSRTRTDGVCDRNIHGIYSNKEKAKLGVKEAVENSAYFDEAENPIIGDDYADTNNEEDCYMGYCDYEEICIEAMSVL